MTLKTLPQLTLGELKQLLLKKGLTPGGGKADCLIRLEEYYRMEGKNPHEIKISVTENVTTPTAGPDPEPLTDSSPTPQASLTEPMTQLFTNLQEQLKALTIAVTQLTARREEHTPLGPPDRVERHEDTIGLLDLPPGGTMESTPQRSSRGEEIREERPEETIRMEARVLPPSALFEMELPTYAGEDWEDPLTYVETLRSVLQYYQIPQRTWTPIGVRQLRGKAAQWWSTQLLPRPGGWEEFQTRLNSRFTNQTALAKLRAEYYSRVQGSREGVENFLRRKHALFRRLFREDPPTHFMALVVELTDPRLRSILRGYSATSIEEFIEMASRIEQDQRTHEPRSNHPREQGGVQHNPPRSNQPGPSPRSNPGQNNTIEAGTDEPSPSVHVNIGDRWFLAKVDTQASVSFIRASVVADLGLTPQPTVIENVQLGTKHHNVRTEGEVEITLTLGEIPQPVRFIILDQLSHELILGNDWLTEGQMVIDYAERTITFGVSARRTIPWAAERQPEDTPELNLQEEQIGENLTGQEREELLKTLRPFSPLFHGLGRTRSVQHSIVLTEDKTIRLPCYRYNETKRKIIIQQIREMEANGVIRPSTSAYASPIVLVRKSSDDWRFCVNYKEINRITRDDAYPMPHIQEQLRVFNGSSYFSTIDLRSGYWQVEMDGASRQYTAFSSPIGLFEFNVMPFGLKNSPMTFQRLMEEVVRGYIGDFVEVYLDDIIIHSPDFQTHLGHISRVLQRLKRHGLTCHPEKCRFAQREIKFLGHIINAEDIRPNPQKIEEALKYPTPQNKKQVQQFLGLCQWFGPFLPGLAELAKPLYKLTGKQARWSWAENEDNALKALKQRLADAGGLAHYRQDRPLFLQTDASEIGLGGVLYQTEDGTPTGERRVIAFGSRQLKEVETRYSAIEREALAIVWSIQKFRDYLEGRRFLLITDSEALSWMKKMKDHNSKIHRWFLLVMGFNFEMQHCSGKANLAADALSRNPNTDSWEPDLDATLPPNPVRQDQSPILANLSRFCDLIREQQEQDPKTAHIKRQLELTGPGEETGDSEKYALINDAVYCSPRKGEPRLLIPSEGVPHAIRLFHDEEGHPGFRTTIRNVQGKLTWPGMRKDVAEYVRKCETCQKVKSDTHPLMDIQATREVGAPMEKVAIDLMGPYPRSNNGKTHILVLTDLYSRWIEAFPMGNPTSTRIAQLLEKEVFHRYGYPRTIISDNGRQFTSHEWGRYMERWGAQAETTPIYHPRANPAERRNQEVKKLMRTALIDRPHKEWDKQLSQSIGFLRNRRSEATGFSPAEIFLSHTPKRPGEWTELPRGTEARLSHAEWVSATQARAQLQGMEVRRRQANQRRPPKKGKAGSLKVGDRVLIRTHILSKAAENICAGLSPRWQGPYTVNKRLSKCIYILDEGRKVHIKDIKPYQQ